MRIRMTTERLRKRSHHGWSVQCLVGPLLTFFVSLQYSVSVAFDCDDVTMTYRCSNQRCIPRHLVNNSVNDCLDNSDEVVNPCRYPLFSCRNDRCVMMGHVLDGINHCIDGSDEAKLIGTNCTMALSCCFCADYVPHSDCIGGRCQCVSSHYSNQLGTVCIRRTAGSECETSSQCAASIYGPVFCDTTSSAPAGRGQCRCPTGYRPRYDQLACVGRRLAEPCRVNPDCQASSTAGVACVGGRCACVAGHVAVSFRTCRLRRLGDLCALDEDCSAAVNSSECVEGRCRCVYDHVWTADTAECQYDGEDTRQAAVGVTLIVGVVIFSVVDVLLVACVVVNCVAAIAVRRRHHLANRSRTNAEA